MGDVVGYPDPAAPPPPPPPPPAPPAPDGGSGHAGPAILLAAAAVVASLLLGRASLVGSAASDEWQRALREELKRAAALVEDVRFVYSAEAPFAFAGAGAAVLAEEERAAASSAAGDVGSGLLTEARGEELLLDAMRPASEILSDEKYHHPDGGFDLIARLADNRARFPDLVAVNPDEAQALGDRLSRKATFLVGAAVAAAVSFLLAALAQVVIRRRTPLLILGWYALAATVVGAVLVEVQL